MHSTPDQFGEKNHLEKKYAQSHPMVLLGKSLEAEALEQHRRDEDIKHRSTFHPAQGAAGHVQAPWSSVASAAGVCVTAGGSGKASPPTRQRS